MFIICLGWHISAWELCAGANIFKKFYKYAILWVKITFYCIKILPMDFFIPIGSVIFAPGDLYYILFNASKP